MALIDYSESAIIPELDGITQMAFSFIRSQMDRDNEKYESRVAANRENGKKGGRPKKPKGNEENPKNPMVLEETERNPENPIKSNDKDNDKEKDINTLSAKPDRTETIRKVVQYLNDKAGKHFKASTENTKKHINARLNEGYSLDDFIAVVDKKVQAWKGDPQMDRYLRPETLFGRKFESYLNENVSGKVQAAVKTQFHNFEERDYDFDELEKRLFEQQLGG